MPTDSSYKIYRKIYLHTIADRADRVLIARGTQLDEYLIESMRKMGITGVYIRTGVIEDKDSEEQPVITAQVQQKIDKRQVKDRAKVHLSESVKKRVAEGIQYLYQDTESSNFMDVTRSITNDLVKAIDDNDAIAVDISALKVSDEYTFKHSVDVATMAMIVSRQYGFNDEQVQQKIEEACNAIEQHFIEIIEDTLPLRQGT